MNNEKGLRGYKAFKDDLTCLDFQYEIGKTYEMDEKEISLCSRGFHFCLDVANCFNFYPFDKEITRIAEVIAYDRILVDKIGNKYCTNKIEIVRELNWEEVLQRANSGNENIGIYNSGCHNVGNYNAGHWNTGDNNLGNVNIGYYNTGHCNVGDWNAGDNNIGNKNTGHYNIGYNCTGDWNRCDFAYGYFNTIKPKLRIFNAPVEVTEEIEKQLSEVKAILERMPSKVIKLINDDLITLKASKNIIILISKE